MITKLFAWFTSINRDIPTTDTGGSQRYVTKDEVDAAEIAYQEARERTSKACSRYVNYQGLSTDKKLLKIEFEQLSRIDDKLGKKFFELRDIWKKQYEY